MIIHWFRQDLRLSDNPALAHAIQSGKVLPIYIWDIYNKKFPLGNASRCWLYHSLAALNKNLNGHLNFYIGDPKVILRDLIQKKNIKEIVWNRCYEPWQIQRDIQIKAYLSHQEINIKIFSDFLLWEPWTIHKNDDTPYKVFSPYYFRGCSNATTPRSPISINKSLYDWEIDLAAVSLDALDLLSNKLWESKLLEHCKIGEHAAQQRLIEFINSGLNDYKVERDFPAKNSTSRLSPHLHFGEISPQQIWHTICSQGDNPNTACFLKELAWREFSYYLLYHFPELPTQNWLSKFDAFLWENDQSLLNAWQKGETGFPIIDAGMRELWQTGTMHNRVRMLVASFLTKNGLIDWRYGADWFWNCLVDADLASNTASWQWVAGSGADAAPYFRIFNPVLQAKRFDPQGDYIRQYVPEIAKLPNTYLFKPWEAGSHELKKANILLGKTYPYPILNLKVSREDALSRYKTLK